MATGVTDTQTKKKSTRKYTLEYEDKKTKKEVMEGDCPSFSKVLSSATSNDFYYGDNLNVLRYLISLGYSEQVRLVYIDPPYATNSAFLGRNQKIAYSDSLTGADYIEFLRERIILIHEILADDGSIYLHLDGNMAFPMKLVMDEVFGEGNCRADKARFFAHFVIRASRI